MARGNAGVEILSNVDSGLRNFMLKVYNYMTTGLLLSGFVGYMLIRTGAIAMFFSVSPEGAVGFNILGWVALLSPLLMVFLCANAASKSNPGKAKALFFLYSALMGMSIGIILLSYQIESVFAVFAITAGTFAALSLWGYTTRKSLTAMGSFLFMGLIGIIIAMVVNLFIRSGTASLAISVLAVLIFAGLTAYDTQRIRNSYNERAPAEVQDSLAVWGALALYLNFINLFFHLLRLLGNRQ